MNIVINPGHCPGLDSGAIGDYLQEADVVKEVGEIVCDMLRSQGHEVYCIQENELEDICHDATATDSDIFVSIHCNAAENRSACGTETYYYPDDASIMLAQQIQENVLAALNTEDRGTKDGSWIRVLNGTEIPATVLVELAFISNPDEEKILDECKFDAAEGIVEGINNYIAMGM